MQMIIRGVAHEACFARAALAGVTALLLAACGGQPTSTPDVCCVGDVVDASSQDASDDGSIDVATEDAAVPVDCGVPATVIPLCMDPADGGIHFERHVLDTVYRNEGVGAFDVSGDGRPDIVTDQFWYDAQDLSASCLAPHRIREPVSWDPATQYAVGFGAYGMDVNRDGCNDVIATPHVNDPFAWYQNPCGHGDTWIRREIEPAGVTGLETPFVTNELFEDHRYVILSTDSREGQHILGWYEAPANPEGPWVLHPISNPNFPGAAAYQHGIGVGNIGGVDARADVLTGYGWFEQTDSATQWPFHAWTLGPDSSAACSRIWTFDVNGDGLNDVFCSRPHDLGIYWYEQRPPASPGAEPTFMEHEIDHSVSQMHALRLADLDHDGTPEIVSGTRWCAHCGAGQPYPDPAVGYIVYYAMRGAGTAGVTFERHVIDCETGVGVAFDIDDIDGDGHLDIAIANKRGLFYYRQIAP